MVQLNAFGPSDPLSQAASAHVVNLRIRHIFQVPWSGSVVFKCWETHCFYSIYIHVFTLKYIRKLLQVF